MNMPSSKKTSASKKTTVSSGRQYEKKAALFYKQQGFETVAQNWQAAHKEIDLIVRKHDLMVFVEVKSARTTTFGHPAQRVGKKKIENLTRAARQYLAENKIENTDLRFDVVTFVNGRMEHYPNAFECE